MICPRCKNEIDELFGEINGKYYCRNCIEFSRKVIHVKPLKKENTIIDYKLSFELSNTQLEISNKLVEHFNNHINSYVWAVCGSGKTEIVYSVIKEAVNNGKRVCFTVPRRELVIELYERISNDFFGIEIGLLYGGVCKNYNSPFIICTTHQLYKFEDIGFDLMIIDEVDAFPFSGNDVLNCIFENCCRDSFIQLSATFVSEDIVDGRLLVMNKRYHGHLLPVPKIFCIPYFLMRWLLLFILQTSNKQWIIYTSTINQMKQVTTFLKKYIVVEGISSKTRHNKKVIDQLKNHQIKAIVSTTILERGITIEDIQVVVYEANHRNFNFRTLIQIAGRVGRKPNHPFGKVLFLSTYSNDQMKKCIQTIDYLNSIDA